MKKAYLLLIVVFISCCKDMEQTDNCEEIRVDFNKATSSVNAEDYFDVEPIFLAKTDACLIGTVTKVVAYEDYLFVLDNDVAESLFLFDRKGQFIRKFGQKGKAKGEYLDISDFNIRENHVYLLDGPSRKIHVFDFNGKFIKSIKLSAHGGFNFHIFNDESIISTNSKSILSIDFWDRKGRLKHEIYDKDHGFINWDTGKSMSVLSDTLFVSQIFNDTIFEVNRQDIYPRYKFNFGKKSYPIYNAKNKDEFGNMYISNNYMTFDRFSISKDFIFLNIISENMLTGIYFKKDQKMLITDSFTYQDIPLAHIVGDYEKGVIYSSYADFASLIIGAKLEANLDTEISSQLLEIKPDDNPLIFIIKQKE